MERATTQDIAKLANVNVKTVRKIADKGLVESRRDYNGWRIFPNPEKAAETVRQLLLGEDFDSNTFGRTQKASGLTVGH